jgi:lipopolysaccharide export system protein LptC
MRVTGPDGYRLATSDVTVDLKQRSVLEAVQVRGEMRLGQFSAGRLRADLGERTVILDRGARLKIVQGAVR